MLDHRSPLTTALADRYRIERELGQGGMATATLIGVRNVFERMLYDRRNCSADADRSSIPEVSMQPIHPLLLFLLVATAGCGHSTYNRKPGPASPADTLNGQPREHAPTKSTMTPTRDDPRTQPRKRSEQGE
jgi:hypothetical protein